MPGSLNYSPSGSEGGRSLGGGGADPIGIDLVATPGTTPLKWRGRTSSNSDGGGLNVQEEANGRATDLKKIEKPQDRVPPRIATRKPSSEATATAAPLDERAGLRKRPSAFTDAASRKNNISDQPEGLSRDGRSPPSALSIPRRTSLSASSNTDHVADRARGVREDECRDVAQDDNHGAAGRSLAGHSLGDSQRSDENKDAGCLIALLSKDPSLENEDPAKVSNFREEQSPWPLGATTEGHRGQDGTAPLASAPPGDPQPSTLPHAGGGHSRDDGKSASPKSAQSPRPIPTAAVESATALARKASFSRGEDTPLGESKHGERQRSSTLTPSNEDDNGRNAGVELQAAPSVARTATSNDLRAATLEGGADNTADDSDDETRGAGGTAVGLASTTSGGDGRLESNGDTRDWLARRWPSTSKKNPKGSTGDNHLSKTSPSMAGVAAEDVPRQPDAIGQACKDAVAMDSENNQGADAHLDGEQHQHRRNGEERALQGHTNANRLKDDEHVSAAANLVTGADPRVSLQRRSSGGRNSTEDAIDTATCIYVPGGRESPNPTATGGKRGTVDGVRETGLIRSSINRELLQSPPMIPRRNPNAQSSKPLAGADNTVEITGARQPRKDFGATPPSRAVEAVCPGYRDNQEQWSAPKGPPPHTPRRDRSPSTAATGPSNPRSPVATAARVVSLEESARSTLRMKRAAEAIALEDAQIHACAERQNERLSDPPEHPATPSGPPIEPKEENEDNRDPYQEQEARARRAEKMRVRAPRDIAARHGAGVERDIALELTLEVLRRKRAGKRQGVSRLHSAPGRKEAHSPPRRSKRPAAHRTSLARKIKDSAASLNSSNDNPKDRSCGLSSAQVLLLRRSREVGRGGGTPRAGCERRIDELAQPRDNRPATRTRDPATEALLEELTKSMTDKERREFVHACLADAKECTHRPHTRSLAAQGGMGGQTRDGREGEEEAKDESGAARARDAFLYRVDAQERAKATAMEHRRGELAYKAVLDKRMCPGCGAEQSYDEVQEKRKTCPNCEMEYRKPRTWATVRKDFLDRMEAFQQSKWESLQAATETSKKQNTTLVMGRSNREDAANTEGDVDDEEHCLLWEDVEDDFLSRLQEDAVRRQASLASRSAALHQDWTFQPTLSAASERVVGDSAWAGMSFMERVEEDLQRRRETLVAARDYFEDCSGYSFGGSYASNI